MRDVDDAWRRGFKNEIACGPVLWSLHEYEIEMTEC